MVKLVKRMALLLILLTLGGCVYVRLFELKNQFGTFDQNFSVDTESGLTLVFLKPVLREDDMRTLQLPATSAEEQSGGKACTYVFEKQYAGDGELDGQHDIVIGSRFSEGKLSEISVDERHFEHFSKDLFLAMLKSFGQAKVNAVTRSARSEVRRAAGVEPLERDDILAFLGAPYGSHETVGPVSLRYLYKLRPAPGEASKEHEKDYEVIFSFSNEGELEGISGAIPFIGKYKFIFTDARE